MLSRPAVGFAGRYPDSHPPLWRQSMRDWLPDELEEWEERAAIRTYLGGMKQEHAEKAAWNDVLERCRSRPPAPVK